MHKNFEEANSEESLQHTPKNLSCDLRRISPVNSEESLQRTLKNSSSELQRISPTNSDSPAGPENLPSPANSEEFLTLLQQEQIPRNLKFSCILPKNLPASLLLSSTLWLRHKFQHFASPMETFVDNCLQQPAQFSGADKRNYFLQSTTMSVAGSVRL